VIGIGSTLAILAVALVAGAFYVIYLSGTTRRDTPSIPRIERATAFGAAATILVLIAVTLTVAQSSLLIATIIGVLSFAYVLYTLPEATRRYGYRSSIVVHCTPADAFGLVSDARNWPRYLPEIKVLEPVDVPAHVGSIVHVAVTLSSTSLSADERVVVYEPNIRFGTALIDSIGDGVYNFNPIEGGTEIAYTSTGTVTIRHALLGSALLRPMLVSRMRARREVAMQAIKSILEAPPAVPV
jgi:Polyketide cyclase / dehydrase and lipid transport